MLKRCIIIGGSPTGSAAALEIEVTGGADGRVVYEGERIIIATGSKPSDLPDAPFDGVSVISSDETLNLDPLPRSLAIIGSGAVGVEFAFIFT